MNPKIELFISEAADRLGGTYPEATVVCTDPVAGYSMIERAMSRSPMSAMAYALRQLADQMEARVREAKEKVQKAATAGLP